LNNFCNGHNYVLAIRRVRRTPASEIVVEMSGASPIFQPVFGKVDTGAYRTVLNFDTARALAIADPEANCIRRGTAKSATDEPIPYFVHRVLVQISDNGWPPILFPLEAAFAEKVKRNLFGIDWLQNLCLAFDSSSVHFLRD
jgi:hypothetical protein